MAVELVKIEDRWRVGVRVDDYDPVLCPLLQNSFAGRIERCVNCECVQETFFALECKHRICESCFGAMMFYLCKHDGAITCKAKQGYIPQKRCNTELECTILQCHFCEALKDYVGMKVHLQNKHADLLVKTKQKSQGNNLEEESHPFDDRRYPEHGKSGAHCTGYSQGEKCGAAADAACEKEMDHDDGPPLASSGTCGIKQIEERGPLPESQLCPYCQKPWENQEIADHVTACAESVTECSECIEKVKCIDYENHLLECTKMDTERKSDGTLTNSQNIDGDSQRRQKVEEIEALKEAIKMLEERIERLEKPLSRVIQKLREKADQRNK